MDGASNDRPRRKGCGRRKIEIKKIQNQRKRWVTFSKRKKGLFSKAHQLSTLTGEEIGIIIISEQGRVYTSENADSVLERSLRSLQMEDHNDNDVDAAAVNENSEVNDPNHNDDQDSNSSNEHVDALKIKDDKQSSEPGSGEIMLGHNKNVEPRMKEDIKAKKFLFDLNKTPDEQFFED